MIVRIFFLWFCLFFLSIPGFSQSDAQEWHFHAQRTEIQPKHWVDEAVSFDGENTLAVSGTGDRHDNGCWRKRFDVEGGTNQQFSVSYKIDKVDEPARSVLATIIWLDSDGKQIGPKEFPRSLSADADGWHKIEQRYLVPEQAVGFEADLIYRWDADGQVHFSKAKMEPVNALASRKVKLATVHHRPSRSSTDQNLEVFGNFARQAGQEGADIVCLPEAMTMVGTGKNYTQAAESIPGPTTEYLGKVAKEQQMYIVAGMLEQDGDVVYNTAVLLDRQGNLAGKYRKVCLPREEIEGGVSPGQSFPVFETDFGTIGIMICWDVTFPEPARALAMQGADVILLPIWGGIETLARARSIENQVYLVSSTYGGDLQTGVFDLEGNLVGEANEDSPVVVVEVDLDQQKLWPWLGELKNRIQQEMPSKVAMQPTMSN